MAVIGRNLIEQPRFTAAADESGWYGLPEYSGANLPAPVAWHDTGNRYRAFLTGKTYKSPLFRPIGNIEPGAYYVWVSYRDGASLNADPGLFGIVPIEPGSASKPIWEESRYVAGERDKYLKKLNKPSGDFIDKSATIEIPDMSGWQYKDRYGGELYLPEEHANIEFAIVVLGAGTLNLTSVAGCRLDEISQYDEPLAGYFDGSTPDADGVTYSWDGDEFNSTSTANYGTPETIVITPPSAEFSDNPPQFMLPEVTGVIWIVNGETYEPGAYQVEPTKDGVTVKIVPVEEFGYEFDPPAEEQEYTWYAADPDPDPDPDDGSSIIPQQVIERGGQRVADALGWTEDRLDEARAAYETTLLIAWAYTRGVGFTDDLVPEYPISRAAELAACRLAPNPEQLTRWQLGSDSETMPGFSGFTLAERHVLDRYRVRWA